MATEVDPVVGNWYQRLANNQEFEVVAFDEEDGIVEIQDSDGNFEELDIDVWYDLELEPIDNPGIYDGVLDDQVLEDLGYERSEPDEEDWDES